MMRRILIIAATREEATLFAQAKGLHTPGGWRLITNLPDAITGCGGGRRPQVLELPSAEQLPDHDRIVQALEVRNVIFCDPETFQ